MEEKVMEAMRAAGEPLKAGQVAERIGEDAKAVSKAIGNLKKAGKVVSPKRCFYQPAAD